MAIKQVTLREINTFDQDQKAKSPCSRLTRTWWVAPRWLAPSRQHPQGNRLPQD